MPIQMALMNAHVTTAHVWHYREYHETWDLQKGYVETIPQTLYRAEGW